MANKYGKRIIELAGVVERLQPCTVAQIVPQMSIDSQGAISGACWYGVKYRLLEWVEGSSPRQYRVVPHWRELVAAQHERVATAAKVELPPAAAQEQFVATIEAALASRSPLEQVWAGFR